MVSVVWDNQKGLNLAYDVKTREWKWQGYYCKAFSLIVLNRRYIKSTHDYIETLFHEYLHHWTYYLPLHCTHILGSLIDAIDMYIHYKRISSH